MENNSNILGSICMSIYLRTSLSKLYFISRYIITIFLVLINSIGYTGVFIFSLNNWEMTVWIPIIGSDNYNYCISLLFFLSDSLYIFHMFINSSWAHLTGIAQKSFVINKVYLNSITQQIYKSHKNKHIYIHLNWIS